MHECNANAQPEFMSTLRVCWHENCRARALTAWNPPRVQTDWHLESCLQSRLRTVTVDICSARTWAGRALQLACAAAACQGSACRQSSWSLASTARLHQLSTAALEVMLPGELARAGTQHVCDTCGPRVSCSRAHVCDNFPFSSSLGRCARNQGRSCRDARMCVLWQCCSWVTGPNS